MENHEVIPAFEMLLDEIEGAINTLKNQSAQFFTDGKYDDARSPARDRRQSGIRVSG